MGPNDIVQLPATTLKYLTTMSAKLAHYLVDPEEYVEDWFLIGIFIK